MLDDKHETFRYMNGRHSITNALLRVPQHQQASFVYECMSYTSEHPTTPVPVIVDTIIKLWEKYERLQPL
jgi:hypothetical protein